MLRRSRLRFWCQQLQDWYQWHIAWRNVPKAELVTELNLGDSGGCQLFVHDINGDGIVELLWLQSPGMIKAKLYDHDQGKIGRYLCQCPARPFCLTATTLSGAILWQLGQPYSDTTPYLSHAAENMVACADVDADGAPEVLVLDNEGQLLVLEGRTGKVKASMVLPADNFAQVFVGTNPRDPMGVTILVGVMDQAYPPHPYANPWLFLDSSLQVVRCQDYVGAGHSVSIQDINGDGADEFLIGYQMTDCSGNVLWTLDEWRDQEIDSQEQHVDSIAVVQVDGAWRAALSGSDREYFIDGTGRTLWEEQLPHPQYALIGHHQHEAHIFVFNQRVIMNSFLLSGAERWSGLLPESWPMGRPSLAVGVRPIHSNSVADLVPMQREKGEDWMLYKEGGWPYLVDFHGRVVYAFPPPLAARRQDVTVPFSRINDIGLSFEGAIQDVDHDDSPEVLIYDRSHLWVYRLSG